MVNPQQTSAKTKLTTICTKKFVLSVVHHSIFCCASPKSYFIYLLTVFFREAALFSATTATKSFSGQTARRLATVKYDFNAELENELSLRVGQRVTVSE